MSTPRTDALTDDFEADTRLEDTLVLCRDLEEQLQSAEAKLAVMAEAFSIYGEHLSHCYSTYCAAECNCGIGNVLKNLPERAQRLQAIWSFLNEPETFSTLSVDQVYTVLKRMVTSP